jgi:hypothetical protein
MRHRLMHDNRHCVIVIAYLNELKIKDFHRRCIDKPEIQRLSRPWKIIFQNKDFQRFKGARECGYQLPFFLHVVIDDENKHQ